jgi:hypothetical protein
MYRIIHQHHLSSQQQQRRSTNCSFIFSSHRHDFYFRSNNNNNCIHSSVWHRYEQKIFIIAEAEVANCSLQADYICSSCRTIPIFAICVLLVYLLYIDLLSFVYLVCIDLRIFFILSFCYLDRQSQ